MGTRPIRSKKRPLGDDLTPLNLLIVALSPVSYSAGVLAAYPGFVKVV
jgi:hypothetical protein